MFYSVSVPERLEGNFSTSGYLIHFSGLGNREVGSLSVSESSQKYISREYNKYVNYHYIQLLKTLSNDKKFKKWADEMINWLTPQSSSQFKIEKTKIKWQMRKYLLFLIALFILIVVLLAMKFYTYRMLTSHSGPTLVLGRKIEMFYEEYLRLPKSKSEFEAFILSIGDEDFITHLRKLRYRLKYDSVKDEVYLYTGGMDWDDDQLSSQYTVDQLEFPGSLFKNGDIIIHKANVSSFVDYLEQKSILILNEAKSNDQSLKNRMKSVVFCVVNQVATNNDRSLMLDKEGDSKGNLWIVLDKQQDRLNVQVYGKINITKIDVIKDSIEREILSKKILQDYKRIKMGVSFNMFHPPFSDDCL